MGIASITTMLGGLAAGGGATIVTEGIIMETGHRYAVTKLGKFCVDICAVTVGGAAFTKVGEMFTEQAIEFWDFVDKAKAHIKETKENGVTIDISKEPKSEAEQEVLNDLGKDAE